MSRIENLLSDATRLRESIKGESIKGVAVKRPVQRNGSKGQKDMLKGILIFSKNDVEMLYLKNLFEAEEIKVYDTSNALRALSILQKEDIGVVIAGKEIDGVEAAEFKSLVEKVHPGVSIIFIAPFSVKESGRPDYGKEFSINTQAFQRLISDNIKIEGALRMELSKIKYFSFALAERLLQIFDVDGSYFLNNDHMVAELSEKIARRMELDANLVESIKMAALLKDIGMLGIQRQILAENRRLNQMELTPVKEHPFQTVEILRQVRFPWNLDPFIGQHHEHYNGKGYPMGLKGRNISIGARIIAVADAYFAMTTNRPYRKALSRDRAVQEIIKDAGSHFDPEVVEIFLSLIKEEPPESTVHKKKVLIFVRDPDITAFLKLSINAEEIDILHVTSSIDAIGCAKNETPDLVIADVEALDSEAFSKFYNIMRLVTGIDQRYLLILQSKDYPKTFEGNVDYVTKPLNTSAFQVKMRRMLFGIMEGQPGEVIRGITGQLEDFNLSDIIQILSIGFKTAKVEIIGDGRKADLYLRHGKVVHASTDNLRGTDAFYEILSWDKGKFHIMHGHTAEDINITVDTMYLLLEGMNSFDKKKADKPMKSRRLP